MSAEEAKAFGIVDEVTTKRSLESEETRNSGLKTLGQEYGSFLARLLCRRQISGNDLISPGLWWLLSEPGVGRA